MLSVIDRMFSSLFLFVLKILGAIIVAYASYEAVQNMGKTLSNIIINNFK